MDAFKQNEILRMQYGGNKAWQDFYNKNAAIPFEEATIKERYDSEIGEEWKERLTAQVEDREFDKAAFLKERQAMLQKQASRSATPSAGARTNSVTSGHDSSRTASPAPAKGRITAEQKAQNEAYFSRMGEANASRPDHLPPSQGGKYAGFGSAPPEPQRSQSGGLPAADEFTKDPVAALTKGFGWFSAAVSKQAKVVNEAYIQPTAKNVSSSRTLVLPLSGLYQEQSANHPISQLASTDFAAQARNAALAAGSGIQSGAKGAAESINKFIEGQDEKASAVAGSRKAEPERKDFWDTFGAPSEQSKPSSSIGTSAMRKAPLANPPRKTKEDGWGDDW